MLQTLSICNIVLIDRLELEFESGLTALTGETGAGKSILLDSLSLILGAKAESSLIRKGEEKAWVIAEFSLYKAHPVLVHLAECEIEIEDNAPLIIRRVLSPDGRSKAFINDQPVSAGILKTIGPDLVEIHGQYDNRGLLDPAAHINYLDDFINTPQLNADVKENWTKWRQTCEELNTLRKTISQDQEQESFIRQSLQEIEELAPITGEEEELSQKRDSLKHREQILDACREALGLMEECEDKTSQAWRALDRQLDRAGKTMNDAVDILDRIGAEYQEAGAIITSLIADMQDEDQSLENVDDRLFALRAMARRHHCLVDDLPAKQEELTISLSRIESQDDALSALSNQADILRQAYIDCANALSKSRQEAAQKLDQAVMAELGPLKLEKAKFITQLSSLDENEWGPSGVDHVRFAVATNPGSEPGPLNKVASGGEMARIMLAIKVILGAEGHATLIFDEVDTGIGGSTADAVGERLARLGKTRQIMVVTHSPQVAARAAHHMVVAKNESENSAITTTNVRKLPSHQDRKEEIARMLAGAQISDEARAAAAKLMG